MKQRFFLAGLLASCMLSAKAQKKDTFTRREKLNKTEIEFVYGHYMQDGNNSAVTGGVGTEKLTVFSPVLKVKKTWENGRSLTFKGGSDIISSASTDKIDFVKSSASILDARTHMGIGVSAPVRKKKNMVWSAGTGFSIESDYFSRPVNVGLLMWDKQKIRTLAIDVQMFFDDLRWGRLNGGYYRPVKLIYPQELRFREWYETTRRNSYNLKVGFTRVINKRNIFGIFPEISYQEGLLSTPFHRVYFKGDSLLKVENLPGRRLKGILGLKWNTFAGGRVILKNSIDMYADNFGVMNFALENETAVKWKRFLTIIPFARISFQEASGYFAPYKAHEADERYYTSDYDLSGFYTVKAGLAARYAPFRTMGKYNIFNEFTLRYAYYNRSNGLHAHIVSCVFNMTHAKPRQVKIK